MYVVATAVGATVVSVLADRSIVVAITETRHVTTHCLVAKLTGAAAFAPGLLRCSYQGNAPLNTVMVEIWLYVVYGVCGWLLLRRMSERVVLVALAATFAGVFIYVVLTPSAAGWWNNSSLPGFLGYWWIGALAVAAGTSRRVAALTGGAGAWVVLTIVLDDVSEQTRVVAVTVELRKIAFAVFAAGAIALLDSQARSLPRVLPAVGRSGYSLYAFHAPILIVAVALGWPWEAAVVVALFVAAVMYVVVEAPSLRLGRRLSMTLRERYTAAAVT